MDWRLILPDTAPPRHGDAATRGRGDGPAFNGAHNMGVDQALLESVQTGGRPALRFYSWRPACLSLGRNQPARGRCNTRALDARGLDVVRRPTGGYAVLHDREVTYAVAVPVGALGSPRETYLSINQALVTGLRALGVPATLANGATRGLGDTGTRRPLYSDVCFAAAAPGEVVVGGGKLVGSAQRCERRAILQHGSVLLSGTQDAVAELLAGAGARPATTSLAQLLAGEPEWAPVADALAAGFRAALGIRLAPEPLSVSERARTRAWSDHFGSSAWTWRR